MSNLYFEFFANWQAEIKAYKEVLEFLTNQKKTLVDWDIEEFNRINTLLGAAIYTANEKTEERDTLLEAIIMASGKDSADYNLKNIAELIPYDDMESKVDMLFKGFSSILASIDDLSAENKKLIATGLNLINDNINDIAILVSKKSLYKNDGAYLKRESILFNARI